MPFLAKVKRIRDAVFNEFALHPESRLTDYFKYFAQSAFGPGHIISDYESARQYLLYEIEHSLSFDHVILQSCDYFLPFYRVNLKLVKDKHLDFDLLFSAFIESASSIEPISESIFREEWEGILQVIKIENMPIPNFEEDIIFINELMDRNKFICHHSEGFKKAYNPHYRLIHQDFLPKNILFYDG